MLSGRARASSRRGRLVLWTITGNRPPKGPGAGSPQKGGGSASRANEKIGPVNVWRKPAHAALAIAFAAALSHSVLAAGAAHSTKADEQAGALLFRQQDCAHCHGPEGIGGKKAPPLTNLRKNKDWPPEKITHQILNGGQKMPPFGDSLTDAQIAQLVAYLRAKHKPVLPDAPAPAPASTPAAQ
jgi:mono/diheme cytochrome c family protein